MPPAAAAPADDGRWVMPAKNYASTRFSELAEITTDNVRRLGVAFTFSTGVERGHEAAPIVADGTMYVVTPFPNHVYALDLTRPGAPVKWMLRPEATGGGAGRRLLRRGQSRCRARRRQAVLQHAGRAHGGARRRHRQGALEDQARRDQQGRDHDHGAPGGEGEGAGRQQRGRVRRARLAHRARRRDGHDRLAGLQHRTRCGRADRARLQAVLSAVRGQGPGRRDLAARALADRRRHGLGVDLLRSRARPDLSTAPATRAPGTPTPRPGDNNWTAGIFARDPDTGEARWFYQWNPHDLFDYDGINEQILLDMEIGGQHAEGAGPPRAQRLRLRPRPGDGRGALGRPLRAHHQHARRRPQERPADREPGEEAGPGQGRARHLPGGTGGQGLAALRLFAAHGLPLHAAPEPVHGLRGGRGQLHRRHALCRRQRAR